MKRLVPAGNSTDPLGPTNDDRVSLTSGVNIELLTHSPVHRLITSALRIRRGSVLPRAVFA